MSHPATRATINVEDARVLEHSAYAGDQYVMRLQAPATAAAARPGNFVHMVCDPAIPMRRPMSIMRVNRQAGWFEMLYKTHGLGTLALARRQPGNTINLLGPIGKPFKLDGYKKKPLLIGGGVGIPPMIFLAEHIKSSAGNIKPFVIMGSEVPFVFTPRPSQILVPGVPDGTIACLPLLEDLGIASRLTSRQSYPGCFDGYVTDLARAWLTAQAQQLHEIEIFSCGPTPMLRAVAALAREFNLPCQVSLEEYMACGVGGCAGCVVRVNTEQGVSMQRVCVDGPVFEAVNVFLDDNSLK
ncbi:MAG: 2-polyprenylphenol hydroxylase [Gammaproteobacteria bacterium]|nr:2-polyprenylphenol hydroxylase [Gammaproteobacteria bacterium]